MNWRGKLFTRIFLGFWLVTTAVLASWMLANQYFEARPGEVIESRRPGPPQRFILQMIFDLQNAEPGELPSLIQRARSDHNVDIFLLTRKDTDLLDRVVPDEVLRVADQLRGARRRAHMREGETHLVAFDIYRAEYGAVRAVFVLRPSAHQLVRLLGSSLWLRIGLAILISGLLCFGLSRLITRRLKALQRASRRLANGDFSARLQARERGGDETDELARDFNSMAQQLQARIEAQRRLLVDVSHELRSPLARLRVALALAQEVPSESPRYLQRIEQETERLEELIGQLLASQARDVALDAEVDLVPLLRQLVADANFEGSPQRKQVSLACEVPRALVASSGDLLLKSLENILRNALAHTPEGTAVAVTLEGVDNRIEVRIQDQGGGLPETELGKIFEAFYRTDQARSRDSGGYGLGLAIARHAVRQHGGDITARNCADGLLVTVSLPLATGR